MGIDKRPAVGASEIWRVADLDRLFSRCTFCMVGLMGGIDFTGIRFLAAVFGAQTLGRILFFLVRIL